MNIVFKIEAVLDITSVSGSDDAVPGKVWIVLDDVAFPEAGWAGAVDTVLGSMISAVSDLRAGGDRAVSHFAGEPCYLSFESLPPDGSDRVQIATNWRRSSPAGGPSGTLSVRELAVELHRVVDRLWAQCLARDPGCRAVQLLERLCVQARALLWNGPRIVEHHPGFHYIR